MEVTEEDYLEENVGWANFDDVQIQFDLKGKSMAKGLPHQLELAQDATDTTYDTRIMDHSLLTEDTREEEEESQDETKRRCWLILATVIATLALVALALVLIFLLVDMGGGSDDMSGGSDESPTIVSSDSNKRTCNGLMSNCDLKVNEAIYATVNEAMSSKDEGFEPFNNLLPLEDALEGGFRGLFLSSCECGSQGVQLCSEFCSTGYRPSVPVFRMLYDFLESNPSEVIILNIEVFDDSLLTLFADVFDSVPGLESHMYSHPNIRTEWPTLGDLIDFKQRLIVFQHGGPNCAVHGECPPGVHNTYAYMFDTPSDAAGLDGIKDYDESCSVARGSSVKAPFFISNHHAQGSEGLPNPNLAVAVNDEQTLKVRLEACQDKIERKVNMLAVDFWSIGDTLRVVQSENERRSELLTRSRRR